MRSKKLVIPTLRVRVLDLIAQCEDEGTPCDSEDISIALDEPIGDVIAVVDELLKERRIEFAEEVSDGDQ